MKVALVYDRVNKWGGAERVLLVLHEMFPEAALYTSVYNPKTAPWARVFDIKTSFLQNLPLATSTHELYATLMPLAFESFNFDEYDLVISLTSEAAKGIVTKPKTLHVCYCLTPTRYLWSGYEDYFRDPILRLVSKPAVSYLQTWDKIAAARPDYYIAISKEVQGRIKKYYGRESEVVYPPVMIGAEVGNASPRHAKNNYFLVVSRLVPYKRVDIVVDAFNKLGWPLKVVGVGSELAKLKGRAHKNVEFIANLTDGELLRYYEGCIAFVFAGIEDFGLSLAEAQRAGKPVIAFREGGALEIVNEGVTGELFSPQTKEALVEKLKSFMITKYKEENCARQAEQFNKKVFQERFKGCLFQRMQAFSV